MENYLSGLAALLFIQLLRVVTTIILVLVTESLNENNQIKNKIIPNTLNQISKGGFK